MNGSFPGGRPFVRSDAGRPAPALGIIALPAAGVGIDSPSGGHIRMRRTTRALGALLLCSSLAPGAPVLAQERPTLELTLDEAVKRALENNADIAVERYNPESGREGVRLTEGYYDPFLSSNLNKNKSTSPQSNAFAGGTKVTNTTDTWNFGLNQAIPTGGAVSLTFNNHKQDNNSIF